MAWYSLNVIDYHHNNKSIAIVDDDEDTVNLFTYFLRENGYDVIGFTDPLLLLDYIFHHDIKFRLILIDYKMP